MLVLACAAAVAWSQTMSDHDAALIQIARRAIQAEVLGQAPPKPTAHSQVRPVFVTIERKGKILGCRGDLTARSSSLEDEIAMEARAAATHDPRYHPVTRADLADFLVTVTIVSGTERIESVDGLQPSDGLVLESGSRKGIVLPWEGNDPHVRLHWAYQKAGVLNESGAVLYRLIATRCRG